jgi:hypothetical protein
MLSGGRRLECLGGTTITWFIRCRSILVFSFQGILYFNDF